MTTIYSARWLVPIASQLIEDGAVAVDGESIVAVGRRVELFQQYPAARSRDFGNAVILPGLVNTHTHFELTAMRGFLEREECDFFAWLKKLTLARLNLLTADDLEVSVLWGCCEAIKAGITCVGDASDSAITSMRAINQIGLRGVVFQESFGPDPRLVAENLQKLKLKIAELRSLETRLTKVGVSPHAPYTVSSTQLEAIAVFAKNESLPLMMHAAESEAEDQLLRKGSGLFADNLRARGIDFSAPGCSVIQFLKQRGILSCQPLLAHCIRVDQNDIETLFTTGSKVAHCPKSNAKLRHGHAPFAAFLQRGVIVGMGSDSVAANNNCDILEEARFAVLLSRANQLNTANERAIEANDVLKSATFEGARCLGFEEQVGELRAGMQADITVISLDAVHQLPVYDPITATIFSSSGRDVALTVVAGRELYSNGEVVGADEERLKARILEIAKKLGSLN